MIDHWKCDVCGDLRPDSKISVLTYALKNLDDAQRNLKYCKDRKNCHDGAIEKSRTERI